MTNNIDQVLMEDLPISFYEKTKEFKDDIAKAAKKSKAVKPAVKTLPVKEASPEQLENMIEALDRGLPKQSYEIVDHDEKTALIEFLNNEITSKRNSNIRTANILGVAGL